MPCCSAGWECEISVGILAAIALVIFVAYILMIFYTRTNLGYDHPLNQALLQVPGAGANFWPISHFVTYLILGFIFPCCDILIIGIGAIWEIAEHMLGQTAPPIRRVTANGVEEVQWWHGEIGDIVINTMGFYIGKSLRLTIFADGKAKDQSFSTETNWQASVCSSKSGASPPLDLGPDPASIS